MVHRTCADIQRIADCMQSAEAPAPPKGQMALGGGHRRRARTSAPLSAPGVRGTWRGPNLARYKELQSAAHPLPLLQHPLSAG